MSAISPADQCRWWSLAGQDIRRRAFYNGASMCAMNTGVPHGPARGPVPIAAPASRIAYRAPDGARIPDARRIPLVILEPDAFRVFCAAVTRDWSEIPGMGAGNATVSGPIADAIAGAIGAHRNPAGADSVWVADTRGRTLARSVYPWNGAVRVTG